MSAAEEAREVLEEAEAAIRRQATYLEPHTGRYKCAISEAGMKAILDAIEAYADIRVASADRTERAEARTRQRRLKAAEADAVIGTEAERQAALARRGLATAERTGRP